MLEPCINFIHQRHRMKHFFTLSLLAFSSLNAKAQNCSGGFFIPDQPGICVQGDFVVTQFSPGQVLQDAASEIDNLYINMEHSYMGDLVITFICPNGQSILVHGQEGAEPISVNLLTVRQTPTLQESATIMLGHRMPPMAHGVTMPVSGCLQQEPTKAPNRLPTWMDVP